MDFRKTKMSNVSSYKLFGVRKLASANVSESPAEPESCQTDPTEGKCYHQSQLIGFKRTQFVAYYLFGGKVRKK